MKVSTYPYSYRFGQFELQPGERRLLTAGVPLAVQARAFDVLVALVERAGHLVTKEELFGLVWPRLVVEESNLHVQVSALRKILGPTAIAAVSGQGYRFALEVSREVLHSVQPPTAARLAYSRRWHWVAASVAALLIGAAGAWWLHRTEAAPNPTTSAVPSTLSIAILPFDAPSDGELAQVLLPEITDALARNARSVRVAAPGLVASYKGTEVDAHTVGQSVNVRYVAEGEIRRMNGKQLLTERLIDAVSGVQEWSEKFEVPAAQISGDGGAFSSRVGMHLWSAMRQAERARAARLSTTDNAAELWLRGLALNDRSLNGTLAARKLFEQALQVDPRLTEAMLSLGVTYERQIDMDPRADRNGLRRALDDLSLRAITTDGSDPRAWELRAMALYNNSRWEEMLNAVAEIQRIEPNRVSSFGQRAQALIELGRSKEALLQVDQGLALDPSGPFSALLWRQRCKANSYLGEYREAITACEKAASLEDMLSPHVFLTADFAQLGEIGKAESAKARLLQFSPGFTIARWAESSNVGRTPAWLEQAGTNIVPGLRKVGIPDK